MRSLRVSAWTLALVSTLLSSAAGATAAPERPPAPYLVQSGSGLPAVTVAADREATTATTSAPVGLGAWTNVPRTWPVPTGGFASAYDSERDEMFVFGGCCFHGDTWLYKDGTWRRAAPSLLAPDGRAGNVAAFDPIREEIVMLGGTQEGETWLWNGSTWEMHAGAGPQFRNDAAMAFMPRIGKIVLFGGYPDTSSSELGTQLGDTWTWDGSAWMKLDPATSPPDRYAAGLALDPLSGDLILFGGMDDEYDSLGDTWRFDGTTWTHVESEVSPPPRSYLQLASNPSIGGVELFSGYHRETGFEPVENRWFFVDGEWTQELEGIDLAPLPPFRHGGGMVWDEDEDAVVLFGGSCGQACGSVYEERLVQTEAGPRLEWFETPMPEPGERMSAGTLVRDPLGRGTLMHGGFGDTSLPGVGSDTWLWDGEWRLLKTDGSPPSRQGATLANHPATDTVVLFGGLPSYIGPDATTWVFDGTAWTLREPAVSPPARHRHAMAEDRNGNVILFGGFASGGAKLGDTWVWDGETWTQHTGPGPSARAYPQMAYDPVRQETVLFGGLDANSTPTETWVWDGDGWEQRAPATSAPGRLGAAMAWDAVSQRIVLFSGATCAVNLLGCVISADMWTWDGEIWERRESPSGWPSARWFTQAGPTEDGIVLFGGHGGGTGLPMADTWLWSAEELP